MDFPTPENTLLLIIDMQEKFMPAIAGMNNAVSRTSVILRAMNELKCPVIVTEQYPRGLGATVDALRSLLTPEAAIFEKSSFSALADENCRKAVMSSGRKNIMITGVETHVCVMQTALEALTHSYQVFVPCDCAASRREADRDAAFDFMRSSGVSIISSEAAIFMMLRSSTHPSFKAISQIIR